MLYAGTFRSLDISQDKLGQLYEVRIFTGYNPNDLNGVKLGGDSATTNVGPYPVKKINAYRQEDISTHEIHWVEKMVPDTPVMLTLTDHPFVVDYAGDTGDIHKPYRCSSATVSFLQENLNTDFINSIGNGVFVMLLKWKNEVEKHDTYVTNTITGDTLYKTTYSHYDAWEMDTRVYWNDYLPWKYDSFCYDVEWVGFATPDMLSVGYDHCTDKFTLNCQDALSTLEYVEFERTSQLETMKSTLFRMLLTLGVYKDVYITESVRFATARWSDLNPYLETPGSSVDYMIHQQDNFINEDGDKTKYKVVLENMMNYLSLTAIPYKNQLWIVGMESLAQGHTKYAHYRLTGYSDRLWGLPAENISYDEGEEIDRTDTVWLKGEDFCGGTDLSSDIMYNSVKVICDEMRPDPLLPSLSDDGNFEPEVASQNQPLTVNLWDRYTTSTPGQMDEENYHYLEMYLNRVAGGVENIAFFCYPQTTIDPRYSWSDADKHSVTDEDLVVTHHRTYSGYSQGNPVPDWVYGIQPPPPADQGSAGIAGCMACMIDYSDTNVSNRTQVPSSISLGRAILLATPANNTNTRYMASGGYPHNWDDKTSFWNPMVYMKSKPFFGNGNHFLNITGSFTYYGLNGNTNPTCWYPANCDNRDADNYKFDTNYNYIWAKVKLGNWYLAGSSRGTYYWGTTEGYVKLWCNDEGLEANTDWRHKAFSLETTNRGIEGITVELPIGDDKAEPCVLEIWIDRPLGPGSQSSRCAQSTVINDLSVNVYSSEYVDSRKRRNPDKDNTEYTNPIVSGAIEEMEDISLIHSSNNNAGLSYSETAEQKFYKSGLRERTEYFTAPHIFNEGVGQYGLPEQVKVEALVNQGKTPTIVMRTQVFNNIVSPISRIFWTWLYGKSMMVDSLGIDYEYEQVNMSLVEIKVPATTAVTIERANRTRNLYRTGNIIFNGRIARRNPKELTSVNLDATDVQKENHEVIVSAGDDDTGVSILNVDWAKGLFRLTTPTTASISASSNNGEVTLTI